jgi:3',5'-cyclic AMP phosphodiesterase CpdA
MPRVMQSKLSAHAMRPTGIMQPLRRFPRATVALAATVFVAGTATAFPVPAHAQSAAVRGAVFNDANRNGVRNEGEKGVANVAVSNQTDVVITDAGGSFEIAPGTTGIVSVSIPSGYQVIGKFWRALNSSPANISFAIAPQVQPSTFSFIHASDPHIEPSKADRYRRFRTMADSLHPAFVLMLGDLIRDAMSQQEPLARSYFDLFTTETKAFKTPVWTVPGNHDHFGIIRSRSHVPETHPSYNRNMYREYFGPDYYSFNYGGVHFVGLNSISVDDSAYYGDIDSVQIAWLKQDLSRVAATTPVVTFNHIPLVSGWDTFIGFIDLATVSGIANVNGVKSFRHTVRNTLDVIDAMKGHNFVLALGAHMHAPEQLVFLTDGMRVRYEVSAAIVGGTSMGPVIVPSGFTLYTVRNGVIDEGKFIHLDPVR